MGVGGCCELWGNLWISELAFLCHGLKGNNSLGGRSPCLVCRSLITEAFSKCKENACTNQTVHEGTSDIQGGNVS